MLWVHMLIKKSFTSVNNETNLRGFQGPDHGHIIRLHDPTAVDTCPRGETPGSYRRPPDPHDHSNHLSSTNDTIQALMGSTPYTVTIPTSQYTGDSLAAAIQTVLTAAIPGSWSCVYYANLISMSISCSNPFTFTGGSFMSQLLSRPYTNSINSYNFSYVPVAGADVLYLASSNFTSLDTVGPNGSHDTLCNIPVTCGFGSVQSYSMSNEVWFDCPSLCTQQLSFQLRDRSYNILTQLPNISFVLTID